MKKILKLFIRWSFLPVLLIILSLGISSQYWNKIQIDTSFDRLLDPNDPEKEIFDRYVDSFSEELTAFLYFEDKDLFDNNKLEVMKSILNEIRKIDEVQFVDSVFTSTHVRNDSGLLDTSPVFYSTNLSQEEKERSLEFAMKNPLIGHRLINVDEEAKNTLFVIRVKTGERPLRIIDREINNAIAPYKNQFSKIIHSGHVALRGEVMRQIIIAQEYLLPVVIALILLIVWFGIGHWSAPIIIMGVFLTTIGQTLGLMSAFGYPIQMMISSSSIIIFVLGSTELVHIMDEYAKGRRKGKSVEESLLSLYDHIGKAIILTSFTTIVGFLSVGINDILMLKEFGIITGLALCLYVVNIVLWVPAFYAITDRKEKWTAKRQKSDWTSRLRPLVEKLVSRMIESKFVLPSLVFMALVFSGLSTLVYSENDSIRLFQEHSKIRRELEYFQRKYHGINTLNLVVEAEKDEFKNPELWNDIWALEKKLESLSEVDQVDTMSERLAYINREMNDSNPEEYKIPKSRNLISQYLLMMTRDEVRPFLSSDYSKATLVIRHSKSSSRDVEKLLVVLKKNIDSFVWSKPVKTYITSRSWLNFRAGQSIVSSQTSSLTLVIAIIFLALSFFFKSFKMGLLAMPPNILPALFLFAFMGVFEIPLNIGTCTIAAVTLGLAVDDTIHFFIRYGHEEKITDRPWEAARNTLYHEMNPILTTSISLAIGLSILGFSVFVPLDQFGLLSALVLLFAVVCDLFITPYILVKFKIRGIKQIFEMDKVESIEQHIKHGPLMKHLGHDGVKRLVRWSSYVRLEQGEKINLSRFPESLIVVVKDQFHIGKNSMRESEKGNWIALREVRDGDSFVVPHNVEDSTSMMSIGEGTILILDQKALQNCKSQDPGFYLQVCDMMKQVQ
ncbi:MAG: RND family transporter [Bdellovibrio sp.]